MFNDIFKSIRCKSCREKFVRQTPWQVVCGKVECAVKLVEKAKAKKKLAEKKAEIAEKKSRKLKLKTRSDWMKEAQTAFNAYIRERDKDMPCISCGASLAIEGASWGFDCGHYRSVGSAPHLRFHEANAHGQCKHCNRYLSGNAIEYRGGLINRYGLRLVEQIEANQTLQKFTVDDLKLIIADYKSKKTLSF